jgi:L-ascorbate metabolism protein UlaG (beta-lactamase superfamily)
VIDRVHWLGHAGFRLNGPPHGGPDARPIVYIDPWRLPDGLPLADLILVSHDHYNHCSPEDIEKISRPDTVIVANERAATLIGPRAQVLRPWQGGVVVGGVSVRAVPAYTLERAFHAKAYSGLGFLISMLRYEIYFAGDTDATPEMERIGCDIALLPVGGAFTMGYAEAAQIANLMRPMYAIPMHYGFEIAGSQDDGRRFCELVDEGVYACELPIENSNFWPL